MVTSPGNYYYMMESRRDDQENFAPYYIGQVKIRRRINQMADTKYFKQDRNNDLVKDYENGMMMIDMVVKYQISSTRIYALLKRMGIKVRVIPHFTSHINESEEYICNRIEKEIPCDIVVQPYTAPFDLLVNKKRVEVKHRSKPAGKYFKFFPLKGPLEVDIYIFLTGELENSDIFIIPSSKIGSSLSIPIIAKNKNTRRFIRLFKNNWKILK